MYSVQLLPNARGGSTCQIHMPELHASPPSNMSACHDDLHASPRSVASRMAGSRRGDSPRRGVNPASSRPPIAPGLWLAISFAAANHARTPPPPMPLPHTQARAPTQAHAPRLGHGLRSLLLPPALAPSPRPPWPSPRSLLATPPPCSVRPTTPLGAR